MEVYTNFVKKSLNQDNIQTFSLKNGCIRINTFMPFTLPSLPLSLLHPFLLPPSPLPSSSSSLLPPLPFTRLHTHARMSAVLPLIYCAVVLTEWRALGAFSSCWGEVEVGLVIVGGVRECGCVCGRGRGPRVFGGGKPRVWATGGEDLPGSRQRITEFIHALE